MTRFALPLTAIHCLKQVRVEPRPSALNTMLLAFAAKRGRLREIRDAGARSYRSISPLARSALSSKPAARRCCYQSTGQTDGQTDIRMDGRTPDRYIDLAPHSRPILNESVPEIIINDTIFFLKLQSAFS